MTPEILFKAFVQYQSEDAFRELVSSTLDEVYSIALGIVQGPPHLVEETVLKVYWELARKAPRLAEEMVIAAWLREHTCKTAVAVLHQDDRSVDRAALRKEKHALSTPDSLQRAPAGLATRVCQGILLNAGWKKGFRLFLPRVRWPARLRPMHIGAIAVCVLLIVVLWNIPFHRPNPIIQSPDLELTPDSFAQLASPADGGPLHTASPNAQSNSNPR